MELEETREDNAPEAEFRITWPRSLIATVPRRGANIGRSRSGLTARGLMHRS
jgi:hypothetical protein